jgi:hypothetical protein
MASQYQIISNILTYGAYGVSSGTATIFATGAPGLTIGAMPMYIGTVETPATGTVSLVLSAMDQCGLWDVGLNQRWESYNSSVLEQWQVIPSSCTQGAYITKYTSVFMSGSNTGNYNAQMPFFLYASGDGIIDGSTTAFVYAQAFESSTGTIFIKGIGSETGTTTIAISGAYPESTGTTTAFIGAFDVSTLEVELYISGIE